MTDCALQTLVDRHFGGRSRLATDRQLREHLPTCATCRTRYDRQLLLARLDPRAPSAEDRLARGLGFSPAPKRYRYLLPAFAAVALCFAVWPRSAGFQARGTPEQLFVYRVRAGQAPAQVSGEIAPGDELAFAYANARHRHLLIYGVDEHGHVYWYHPAWPDGAAAPIAISTDSSPGTH